jgi:hypothetical protein
LKPVRSLRVNTADCGAKHSASEVCVPRSRLYNSVSTPPFFFSHNDNPVGTIGDKPWGRNLRTAWHGNQWMLSGSQQSASEELRGTAVDG